ncbi:MAG: hypothetical protein IJC50_06405 [Clostridia bacterium]|nr:hypothetical protein [Clostridia bacterium]
MKYFLGIDTSNYTTSLSLVDENGCVCENKKILLNVVEGERGLRQSDAVFSHIKNFPRIAEGVGKRDIAAVGYSYAPRDVENSYMPCFLVGEAVASMFAELNGIPLYRFSHQRGHVRAALYSAGREDLIDKNFVAFHISGGTTDILHVENGIIEQIGGTLDLNAGQAIDRAGVLMGMKFPCGPELERIASESKIKPKISVKGLSCNLSGVENKVKEQIENQIPFDEIAAYVLDFIMLTVDKLSENVRQAYPGIEMIFSGGVTSNRRIASYIGKKYDVSFAEPVYSSDNAAGTALLTYDSYKKESLNDER